ncbi:MAG: fasciclin domain-containing protein [Granulosicoccus sp.]
MVNDPDTLRNILLYHVLPGTTVDAAAATGLVGIDITAGNGTTLQLSQRSDGLYVQNSRIVITDIPAVNGVIHVIDAVLIP